jgi:hypothetical protein
VHCSLLGDNVGQELLELVELGGVLLALCQQCNLIPELGLVDLINEQS